ncbi:MAG: ABC transporter ATP-binding protein [Bacteroidetes bacterium]|jgi:putative ABC transport system ATP-binding protein|nr:ABC transporter ATP-binding protein [Bacteroidota bacterium]MDA0922824.1 ABC transporter ATP-binding protein [Bacteroidota bacterium]MDA1288981.1 ABC transporter ATP-binding protein [Bacteroidota bacterium]
MSIINVNGLKRIYNQGMENEVRALNGIQLNIEQGEFTAIVGPSGSGKTTLLNCIGGLDRVNEGSLTIDGRSIGDMAEQELIDFRLHHIGFVFQAYNLIPVLSAKENVGFIMLLQNIPKAEIDTRVATLLKAVGLEDQLHKRPAQMSGGQQQRVAVARALASKPRFILADEPTANLDSKATSSLLDIMEKLNKEEGVTFLFSTHDQRVIDRARRVITIEDGKIVSDQIQKM